MKYQSLLFASLALLALSSCADNIELVKSVIPGQELTFEATFGDEPDTKTVVQSDGKSIWWSAYEAINIFYGASEGSKFTSTNDEPVAKAKFTGSIEGFTGETESGELNSFWAIYPYDQANTCDGSSITATLPGYQTGKAETFSDKQWMTMAKSPGLALSFYAVGAGFRFSVTKEGVTSVTFKGNNNEVIAGKAKIGMDANGRPIVKEHLTEVKEVTLSAPYGDVFKVGKLYYLAFYPTNFTQGFTITFNTATETGTRVYNKAINFARTDVHRGANFDQDVVYGPNTGNNNGPNTGNIVFADAAAKYACVAKYDTNGDGEVSIEEAEAATSFDGLFTDWKGVKKFDEIKYFKNVHSLNHVFDGCDKLVSITIPENITDLGGAAFQQCSSLTSVDLPSGITAIGESTFIGCSSLSSIVIPADVTSVGIQAFAGCSSLTAIDLPSGVTSIPEGTFFACSSLSSVGIPDNVTSIDDNAFVFCSSLGSIHLPSQLKTIGESAFSGCSSLAQIAIPGGVSSIPDYCFNACTSLSSVSISEGVTSVGNEAFYGVKMWKLELPSTISSLGSDCFGKIVCVFLPSTSPVTIQSNTFDGVKGIFVPSNRVDMYGAMTNWTNYSSRIFPINTYKEKNEFTLATSGAVDMGTSVKWAAYNVGATKPEEYGDYFAWGETQPKTDYYWSSYKWCNGSDRGLTKYCPVDKTEYWDGGGAPDGKTVLDLGDDAARANWGGNWRMPTDEEWADLREGCFWEWTTYEGINGYKVYDIESGNIIFLPAAGIWYYSALSNAGSEGYYWSSSLYTGYPGYAYRVDFYSDEVRGSYLNRFDGLAVRPVTE